MLFCVNTMHKSSGGNISTNLDVLIFYAVQKNSVKCLNRIKNNIQNESRWFFLLHINLFHQHNYSNQNRIYISIKHIP